MTTSSLTEWISEPLETTINGLERQGVRVRGDGHVIEAVELDMADQWDFLEMAGGQIDNNAWINTGLLAASVISIDGIPQPLNVKSREHIRQILRRIGPRGLDALHVAFNLPASDVEASANGGSEPDAEKAAVGNC